MRSFIVFATLLTAGCATVPAGRYPEFEPTVDGQQTSFDVATALYDEATGLQPIEVKSEDGVVTAEVLAAAPSALRPTSVGYDVEVSLGGDAAPVLCSIKEGVLGLSEFARKLTEVYLYGYQAYELKYAFAGTREGLPFVAIHGQYIDRGAGGLDRQTGFLKLVVTGRAETTVTCVQDQFGYRATLEDVALSLAQSAEWKRDKPLLPLLRRTVYTVRKDGVAAGAREVIIRADDEDFRQSWIRTAYLTLRGNKSLEARDVLETYESDPDGQIIGQTYQAREDGVLRADLKIVEGPMPTYGVRGTVDGKETTARFTVKGGLPDLLLQARFRRANEGFLRYRPQTDLNKPVQRSVSVNNDGLIQVRGPGSQSVGRLDNVGFWMSMERSDGWTFEIDATAD